MSEGQWLVDGLKGRHVLMSLIGFFGLMLIANGLFVYFALSTFTGSDSIPYRGVCITTKRSRRRNDRPRRAGSPL